MILYSPLEKEIIETAIDHLSTFKAQIKDKDSCSRYILLSFEYWHRGSLGLNYIVYDSKLKRFVSIVYDEYDLLSYKSNFVKIELNKKQRIWSIKKKKQTII